MSEKSSNQQQKVERLLQNIWAQVLELDKIDIHDHFFHMGGHSLKAAQVAVRTQQALGRPCPVRWIFDFPTIKALSAQLQGDQTAEVISIPRLEKSEGVLSYAQQRLWFIDQYQNQQSANYHIPLVLQLCGSLQVQALEQALNQLIERHHSLRTVFRQDASGNAYQKILTAEACQISLRAERVSLDLCQQHISATLCEPFDITKDRLLRVRLFSITDISEENSEQMTCSKGKRKELDSIYRLVIVQHHIISDGWSMGIWARELSAFYNAAVEGRKARLLPLPIQYIDYAAWEQTYLREEKLKKPLAYWEKQLSGYEDLQLPTDKPRPAIQTYAGAHIPFQLDAHLTDQLKGLCQKTGTTLYMVLLAGLSLVLSRHSGQQDIVVGSPIANRWHPELEKLIGLFVNTLVMRVKTGIKSVKELLEQVKQTTLTANTNQALPFEHLVDQLRIERDRSRSPIFQVMLVWQNISNTIAPSLAGVKAEELPTAYDMAKFDITLSLREQEQEIVGDLEYNTALFYPSTIEKLGMHLRRLLEAMARQLEADIVSLPLLGSEEYKQIIYGWNATKTVYRQEQTLHALFEAQVAKHPNQIALVFENETLTYRELNARTNQLARVIRKTYREVTGEALKPDTLIAILVEGSIEMVTGVLGILKAGGAYVPIDPAYPQKRIQLILLDTEAKILLTQSYLPIVLGWKKDISISTPHFLYLDEKKYYYQEEVNNLSPVSGPHDLAYVLYTSGTTGKPKGVMVEQHSVANFILHVINQYGINIQSHISQFSTLSFDASVVEIYGALLSGAKLSIVPASIRKDPVHFSKFLEHCRITFSYISPSLFSQMPVSTSCQTIALLGESPNGLAMQRWASRGHTILNAYGPTEATVWVSTSSPYRGGNANNIGSPISNTQIYVLDEYRQPVPVGVSGELYIGGSGVARGYLHREELTQDRFVINPFASEEDKSRGENLRLYKTGDLSKWDTGGNLIYLGRTDSQVKLRGHRVELGEIEAVLASYPNLVQVAVVLQEVGTHQQLVAYYVLQEDTDPGDVTADTIRAYLQTQIPDYMIPSFFIPIEQLPVTVNGKIDRKALSKLDIRGQLTQNYVEPHTEIERKLCEIWQNVLGIDQIGVRDDFFRIGGHSLLAIQLVYKINEILNLHLPVSWLFVHHDIVHQAEAITHMEGNINESADIVTYHRTGGTPPLFLIHPDLAGAEVYYDVAKLLKRSKIPIYGINNYNLNHYADPMHEFDQLAAYYAREIIRTYPGERLFLGGWSLGGIFSYGVYHHLIEHGKKVDCIFMIDAKYPETNLMANRNENMPEYNLKEIALKYLSGKIVDRFYQHLSDTEYVARAVNASKVYRSMLGHFKPYGKVSKIVLFQAEKSNYEAAAWKQWTRQFDVIRVEGDHYTIMKMSNLKIIVKHMTEVISHCFHKNSTSAR